MFSLITIVILAIAVFLGGYIVLKATIKEQTPQASTTPVQDGAAVPPTIEPLLNFNFLETKPLPYRPFLTNQHVSMGIKKMAKTAWIRMDRGYLLRIEERKQIMREHADEAIGHGPLLNPAIEELFQEIMVGYLPQRFPTMFTLSPDKKTLYNKATNTEYPVDISDPETMLRYLGENVEEDFYIMCPDENDDIRLQGYIGCFPGGFLPSCRIGQSMGEIHDPVPAYAQRIGKGADKALKRLGPDQFIERYNWSLQTDGSDLFRVDGNNFYPEQGHTLPEDPESINIDECWLRVEHQTLCRLPKSRAVIFCVRSYMTSLHEIKAEGNGLLLAAAFESMPHKLGDYKKTPFWSETVYKFLRS